MGSYDPDTSEPAALPFVEALKDQQSTINAARAANRDAGIGAGKQTFPHLSVVNGEQRGSAHV